MDEDDEPVLVLLVKAISYVILDEKQKMNIKFLTVITKEISKAFSEMKGSFLKMNSIKIKT